MSAVKEAFRALLARVEAATEPDARLFGDIFVALESSAYEWEADWVRLLDAGAWASAAIALVERRRPGWQWSIDSPYAPNHKLAHAELWTGDDEAIADAHTPALAALAALLKAEIAHADEHA